MGKVLVRIKLTNLFDIAFQKRGASKAKPRHVEVEALADTGATRLYLKPSVIKRLGLLRVDTVRSQTTNGEALRCKYEPVQLELMGRKESFDVIEVPESVPNLLGQVPLEVLDFVVESKGHKLIPNPAHGGEQMIEEYRNLPRRARTTERFPKVRSNPPETSSAGGIAFEEAKGLLRRNGASVDCENPIPFRLELNPSPLFARRAAEVQTPFAPARSKLGLAGGWLSSSSIA